MKKLAFLLVLVVAFTLAIGAVAFAETPHGPFDDDSAVCAACHRAHTSSAEYLLATPQVTGLCVACHDGSGADTNVINGFYVVDGTETGPSGIGYNHFTWGAAASPLMGGGFTQVRGAGVTSAHMTPGTGDAQTLFDIQFGSGSAGPGNAKFFLDCVDCHMPHRSLNYRMLRVTPTGYSGANLSVPDNGNIVSTSATNPLPGPNADDYSNKGRRYTEDFGMFNYTITNASVAGAGEGVSKWCGLGCHDFYYRNAVRGNNGEGAVGAASPAMQTRVTTSVTNQAPIAAINVANTTAMTVGTTYVRILGVRFLVTAKTATSITTTTDVDGAGPNGPGFDWAVDVLAGTPVSIEGRGMEVYYDLDTTLGADPTFMHAVDVDLNYTPRNGSSGNQTLGANLTTDLVAGAPDQSDKLPVADTGSLAEAYDDGDRLTCLTCHRAHGTAATMANEAAIPARNISGIAFPAGTNSMLLRLNDRGVCQQCHAMPTGF